MAGFVGNAVAGGCAGPGVGGPGGVATDGARGAAAVSYTHLRAHETVLDLGCRLLLEKKKNTNGQRSSIVNMTRYETAMSRYR